MTVYKFFDWIFILFFFSVSMIVIVIVFGYEVMLVVPIMDVPEFFCQITFFFFIVMIMVSILNA